MNNENQNNNVCQSILDNYQDIIPVIFDDMFEVVQDDNSSITINKCIANHVRERGYCSNDISILEDIEKNLYYGISRLKSVVPSFRDNIIYKRLCKSNIRLRKCVKDFLIKSGYNLIVTTFPLPIIEETIDKEMGGKVCVSKYYVHNGRNDLPILMTDKIVVYHLFGGEPIENIVFDEESLLNFMHSFHNEDTKAKGLLNYINAPDDKLVLILGSTLPNWIFRFLLYPMYDSIGGYWISNEKVDSELTCFLSKKSYEVANDLKSTAMDLDIILKKATPDDNVMYATNNRKKVFVSYKREKSDDKKNILIDRVVDILKNDFDVWRDTEQVADGGNPYWKNIKNEVKSCDIFIPVVTVKYIDEFKDAPDISTLEKVTDIIDERANDSDIIQNLNPVVREMYYADQYKKRVVPIVIVTEEFDGGKLESIAKDKKNAINLPENYFVGRTFVSHYDMNPVNFDKIN